MPEHERIMRMNLRDLIASFAEMGADERPETMFTELLGLYDTEAGDRDSALEAAIAEKAEVEAALEAANRRISEVVAHNYELMKATAGTEQPGNDTDTDTDETEDEPYSALFEDDE